MGGNINLNALTPRCTRKTLLRVVTTCFLFSVSSADLDLEINLNGIPLKDRPFVDDTYFSEPRLTWKIIGEKDKDLRQTEYAISVDGGPHTPFITPLMEHFSPRLTRSIALYALSFICYSIRRS